MNDKAAEALLLAMQELDRESEVLLAATKRLELEARKLLDAVNLCFPRPPETQVKEQPAIYFQPPSTDWLH